MWDSRGMSALYDLLGMEHGPTDCSPRLQRGARELCLHPSLNAVAFQVQDLLQSSSHQQHLDTHQHFRPMMLSADGAAPFDNLGSPLVPHLLSSDSGFTGTAVREGKVILAATHPSVDFERSAAPFQLVTYGGLPWLRTEHEAKVSGVKLGSRQPQFVLGLKTSRADPSAHAQTQEETRHLRSVRGRRATSVIWSPTLRRLTSSASSRAGSDIECTRSWDVLTPSLDLASPKNETDDTDFVRLALVM
ncbi:hypothetical protein B0H14DRAFT_2560630 [Mycena olivaceomarginata]|nr:hypothetical protein B0H14DRAFT_2560630 [Mycena olivaceomarginata]